MQKTEKKYVLGVDFGTLSARALLLCVSDGSVAASHARNYTHGVMDKQLPDGTKLPPDFALSQPSDFIEAMGYAVSEALKESGIHPKEIIGLGIDATSCTLISTDASGTPLCEDPALSSHPHAYAMVWKHHAAYPYARHFQEIAQQEHADFLKDCGNHLSCEWAVPKMLEVRAEDPGVYKKAAYFLDLTEWLTWKLTGELTRSISSAGFKFHWKSGAGYPTRDFFNKVAAGFGDEFYAKATGQIRPLTASAGNLTAEAAEILGLPEGLAIAVGSLDGQISTTATGSRDSRDCVLVVGTSNVITFVSREQLRIPHICGTVYGGYKPGLYAYEAGQACTGDMLDWFINNMVPHSYYQEATEKGRSIYQLLSEKAAQKQPYLLSLTVTDWMNGSRNLPADMSLKGFIAGLSLDIRPEDIYCAILQGIACTTRIIMEHCAACGASFERVIAVGGIPCKNPFYMQQYANILGKEIFAATSPHLPAVGAAIQAACAAPKSCGGYQSLEEAEAHMKWSSYIHYKPDQTHRVEYEAIYRRFLFYHDLLAENKFCMESSAIG